MSTTNFPLHTTDSFSDTVNSIQSASSLPAQFFTRPQGTLAYTDYGGNGQLVLMLPGMGALRSEYRFLAPQLREAGYHPITLDLRGHGESSPVWDVYDVPSVGADILALIEYMGVGPAHLITTSFSPGAAIWAAAERPEAVHSLTLIGAFVRDAKFNPIINALFWLMMNNPWRVQMWKMFYKSMYPTQKPQDFEAYLNDLTINLSQPGRFDAVKRIGASSRKPSEERMTRVQAPTLVIMGTKDPDFADPTAEATFIAETMGGQLALIEGAGHYPQTEMPEKTTPVILDFLAKL